MMHFQKLKQLFYIVSFTASYLLGHASLPAQNFWEQTNGPYGGSVSALVRSSKGDIFAGTFGAGVWRSTNIGVTWEQAGKGLTESWVIRLAAGPEGDIFASTFRGGLFRLRSDSDTWSFLSALGNPGILSLTINDQNVFAGSGEGIVYGSVDGGDTWMEHNVGVADRVISLANDDDFVFAGTDRQGVFRSSDNGMTWASKDNGLPERGFSSDKDRIIDLALGRDDRIFAATDIEGVFFTTNAGDDWMPFNNGLPINEFSISSLVVAPTFVFVGTDRAGIFRSPVAFERWEQVNDGLPSNLEILSLLDLSDFFLGPTLASTFGAGVFRSDDLGDNWTQVNTGLVNSSISNVAIDTSNSYIYAGSEGVFRSSDWGRSWVQVTDDPRALGVTAMAINSVGAVFIGTDEHGIFISEDKGNSWKERNQGLTNLEIYALTIYSDSVIFAGTDDFNSDGGVFRSFNWGVDWERVSKNLTQRPIVTLAINDSGHVFAGTVGDGIFRSNDLGENWTAVNRDLSVLAVRSIAIHPSGSVFAGTYQSGLFGSERGGGVFQSVNNGASWMRAGLVDTAILEIGINSCGDVFAATFDDAVFLPSGRVFQTTNMGRSWTEIKNGIISNPVVLSFAFDEKGVIFAGTLLNGVFKSVESTTGSPPLIGPAALTAIDQTSVSFGGSINPNGLDTQVRFEFGPVNGDNSTIVDQGTLSGLSPVPISVNLTDLLPTTEYFFRLVATNCAGPIASPDQFFTTYSSEYSLKDTIKYEIREHAFDYRANDYRIAGLPGRPNFLVSELLSGSQNIEWQIFRDNGLERNFFERFDGGEKFRFDTGRAFWIINKGDLIIDKLVPTAPLNTEVKVEIKLQDGYNLITNPFNSAINWAELRNLDKGINKIHEFVGFFRESQTFEPYTGYYYFNKDKRSTLAIPYSLTFSTASTAEATFTWKTSISLESAGSISGAISLGISDYAGRDLDRYDSYMPRSPLDQPIVYFHRPDWDSQFSSFATDIRPQFQEKEAWEFNVVSTERQPINLTLSDPNAIPSDYQIYLVNDIKGDFFNLRVEPVYRFIPAEYITKFNIIIGKEEAVQETLSSIIPLQFQLGPNFPNPFNAATEIPVALPEASEIVLKVFNLLGEEARTIHSGPLQSGRHSFIWNGNDANGLPLSTGVYFYHLTTENGVSLSGKMILLR